MNFNERAYLARDKQYEAVGEKEVAKLIFQMKDGAYEVRGGGAVELPGRRQSLPFVWCVPDAKATSAITKVWQFCQTHHQHEFRYAWDSDRPLQIGPHPTHPRAARVAKSSEHNEREERLSRPLARLSLRFVRSEQELIEIAFWFDVVRLFSTLSRIVGEQNLLILPTIPTSPADFTKARIEFEFGDPRHSRPLVELLDDLAPFVSEKS